MVRDVSPTAVKGAIFCFKGVWVMSGCLREFQSGLILEYVEDLVNQEVQRGKSDGSFGLRPSPSSGERSP